MTRILILFVALLTLAPLAAADTPAGEATSSLLFRLQEHDLFPENIAYDAHTDTWLLGSMAGPRIIAIKGDGAQRDFVAEPCPELNGSVGLKADAQRRRLWVCVGRFSLHADHDAAPARTGVLLFDLDTGALLGSWLTDQESDYHIFNDLAVGPAGEVYATSTLMGGVYRIRAEAPEMELLHRLPRGGHNNGIALAADGKRLYVTYDRSIGLLDIATGELTPLEAPGASLPGADGLYLHAPTNSLVAVKPRHNEIAQLYLNDAGTAVTAVAVLAKNHPDYAYPTTGVLTGDTLTFVATSFAHRPRRPGVEEQHGDVLIHQVRVRPRPE